MDKIDSSKEMNTDRDLAIDLENCGAIKGDNSDGRVNWTLKQIIATISLSGLYVGKLNHILSISA